METENFQLVSTERGFMEIRCNGQLLYETNAKYLDKTIKDLKWELDSLMEQFVEEEILV